MNVLVTGSAGFIGANLVMRLLKDMTEGSIVGLETWNLNHLWFLLASAHKTHNNSNGISRER